MAPRLLLLVSSLLLLRPVNACLRTPPAPKPVPCLACAQTLLTKIETGTDTNAFDPGAAGDSVAIVNGCLQRTFKCTGSTIEINAGALSRADADDGTADLKVSLVVICNAAGTAWTYQGTTVTQVECKTGCRKCADSLITSTTGLVNMPGVDPVTMCSTRTLIMDANGTPGTTPLISINGGALMFDDGNDGVLDAKASIVVTCNSDGTAWEYTQPDGTKAGVTALGGSAQGCGATCTFAVFPIFTIPWGNELSSVNGCSVRTETCPEKYRIPPIISGPIKSSSLGYALVPSVTSSGFIKANGPTAIHMVCGPTLLAWNYQGQAVAALVCVPDPLI